MKESLQEQVRLAQIRSGILPEVSFTQMDLPKLDTFETAVTFAADIDPVAAHDDLAASYGQKAGTGRFLFCADSTAAGRFWVRSVVPWKTQPSKAVSIITPKRIVTQLAEGLMYHFALPVCVGDVSVTGGRKQVRPYKTAAEFERWFTENSEEFGLRPIMVSVALRSLRFKHAGTAYRVDHAVLEGALEIGDTDRIIRRLLRGFGSHRRLGLGMMTLHS